MDGDECGSLSAKAPWRETRKPHTYRPGDVEPLAGEGSSLSPTKAAGKSRAWRAGTSRGSSEKRPPAARCPARAGAAGEGALGGVALAEGDLRAGEQVEHLELLGPRAGRHRPGYLQARHRLLVPELLEEGWFAFVEVRVGGQERQGAGERNHRSGPQLSTGPRLGALGEVKERQPMGRSDVWGSTLGCRAPLSPFSPGASLSLPYRRRSAQTVPAAARPTAASQRRWIRRNTSALHLRARLSELPVRPPVPGNASEQIVGPRRIGRERALLPLIADPREVPVEQPGDQPLPEDRSTWARRATSAGWGAGRHGTPRAR